MSENGVEKEAPVNVLETLTIFLHCLWFGAMTLIFFVAGLEYFIKTPSAVGNTFGYGGIVAPVIAGIVLIVSGLMLLLSGLIALGTLMNGLGIKNKWVNYVLSGLLIILSLGGVIWLIWRLVESQPLQEAYSPVIFVLFGLAIVATIIKKAVENIKASLVGLAVMFIGIGGIIWQLWAIQQNQAWFLTRGLLPIPLILVFALLVIAGFGLMFKETKS